jgi:chemotaxis protein MotB
MSRKRGGHEEHENEERWLLTYADLITLLMVFFVVMYAMSNADAQKFAQLAASLRTVFGDPSSANVAGPSGRINISPIAPAPRTPREDKGKGGTKKGSGDERYRQLKRVKDDLENVVKTQGLQDSLTTKLDPKGPKLVMTLSDGLLFDRGTADLTAAARALMKPLGQVLESQPYDIRVEGHTDDVPIQSGRYKNNFKLSTERACNVIEYLAEEANVPMAKMSAGGYGEYRPIADNSTEEGRAKNRRVEFAIYSEQAMETEPALDGSVPGIEDVPGTVEPGEEPATEPAAAVDDSTADQPVTSEEPATETGTSHEPAAGETAAPAEPHSTAEH